MYIPIWSICAAWVLFGILGFVVNLKTGKTTAVSLSPVGGYWWEEWVVHLSVSKEIVRRWRILTTGTRLEVFLSVVMMVLTQSAICAIFGPIYLVYSAIILLVAITAEAEREQYNRENR